MYDLLIKGGTVVDPSQGLHAVRDVALENGLVAAIEPSIDGDAAETIDAAGLIVSPGLMDLHVHAFWGGCTYGIEPDAGNISRGVTTAVDAGSAGAWTFPAFRSHIMDRADTRLYALLNISAAGMVFHDNAELHDLNIADVGQAVEAGKLNTDVVVGIKARLGRVQAADNDTDGLKRSIEAAEAIDGFVMIHIGNSATPLPDLMRMLRPGDAVTHSFHGFADGVLDDTGAVIEGMKEAQARGVVIDVGHGAGGFSFTAADKALSEGHAGNDQQRPSHRQHRGPCLRPRHDHVQVYAPGHVPGRRDQPVYRRPGPSNREGRQAGDTEAGRARRRDAPEARGGALHPQGPPVHCH